MRSRRCRDRFPRWYVSPATDSNLPTGFVGSARIGNPSGGALSVVSAEVDAGGFQPPTSLPLPEFRLFLPAVFNGS